MPRLWSSTIETHRASVRQAIFAATSDIVSERGLANVTMSEIAERAGIGRATLYKYFPDVESILIEWHQQQVARHLEQLVEASGNADSPSERIKVVLTTYALIRQSHGRSEMAATLHRGDHVARVRDQLHAFIAELIRNGAAVGSIRKDVPADELASFCLGALDSAAEMTSEIAVRRLVRVTLDALQPTG
jgi:AcrR family transcriptional regulator